MSKVGNLDELDSVKHSQSRNREWSRAYDVLFQARRYYDNMDNFRRRRLRCKNYLYGKQWDDEVTVDDGLRKRRMTEETYIKEQGNVPLKNNLIRRLVKNVVGVYRSQSKEPICVARDNDEQKYGETMSVVLQYNRQLNRMEELDARTMEEFLISGSAIYKKKCGWRNNRYDCWTDYVNPNQFFIDNNMRDFRGWDANCMGEVHDVSFLNLLEQFATNKEDAERLRDIYSAPSRERFIEDNWTQFGQSDIRQIDFFNAPNPTLCRVIEVWRKESKPRYRCHDYNNGDVYKIEVEDYEDMVEAENAQRISDGMRLGMSKDDIPLIQAEWFVDNYWYYYYLSPYGDILKEGETPYAHGEHPYVFKFYPYIDAETHSFVEDVIDQQRYVNRLITMYDFIMRASAKGVLLCPDDCLPDDMTWDDVASEWAKFNGVVRFKVKDHGKLPSQVANNCTNIGIGDLLQYQLKFFEDISGVNGALQGKAGNSGVSGSLYAQQTQNATMSLLDILETFSQFVIDGSYKDVKNIQQYYDSKRKFNIVGRTGEMVVYDPKRLRDVEFDLSITESTTTPVYRQMANEFLMQLYQSQAITLQDMLQVGNFPFGDELLQRVKAQQQEMQRQQQAQQGMPRQGGGQQMITPELQQQIDAGAPTSEKAQAMLEQMMSGQGIPPSQQQAPLAEEQQ